MKRFTQLSSYKISINSTLLLLMVMSLLQATQPNVIILLTDDQGTLDANCFGSTDLITPNIDKLAAGGIRFTQAYAHSVCCPSRAALFTGRNPQRSGIVQWTQGDRHGTDLPKLNMPTEELTIAEVMDRSIRASTHFSVISVASSITTATTFSTQRAITIYGRAMKKFSGAKNTIPNC